METTVNLIENNTKSIAPILRLKAVDFTAKVDARILRLKAVDFIAEATS